MDGRQQLDRNRRRARRNSHTQDGTEDDEYRETDANNTHERRHSSTQDGDENDGHQMPHRSPYQLQESSGDDTEEDDGHDGRAENTGRLRPPHTRMPSPMPGPSRNAQAPATHQTPIQEPMTNTQPAMNQQVVDQPVINQQPLPGNAYTIGVPPQSITVRLPEFTFGGYYNALPPQQGRPDQRPSHAGFPPNTNQSNGSPHPSSQNATGSLHVSTTRSTPRRENNNRYLTSERGRLQNSTAEDRFLAAGIAPPSQTWGGIASGRHDGEPRNQHMAIYVENVIAFQQRHPGATQNEIANFIQANLEFERRIFEVAIQYRREQYHQRMWMRFRHEYLRRQLGLADAFSDEVFIWLLAVISSSIV